MRFHSLALGLLPFFAGCGIQAGDYEVYRIAFGEAEASADCTPGGPDIDVAEDSTTIRSGDTFAMYKGADGALFLEFGDDVLQGTKGDGGFSFSGQTIDVEYFGTNDANSTTNTQTLTVSVDGGGASVTGTVLSGVVQTCSGAGCSDFDNFSCSGTTPFVGTRVNGIDLEHQL